MADNARPLFSIGAVARMLDLAPATIRTWETRYGLIVPERSKGGQRLYSREQVDQLEFVKSELEQGRRPGEAHRLLRERVGRGETVGEKRIRVLLVEQRLGAAIALRRLLGGESFEVIVADDPKVAAQAIDEVEPEVVVIDTNDEGVRAIVDRMRRAGTKVLQIDVIEGTLALLEEPGQGPEA